MTDTEQDGLVDEVAQISDLLPAPSRGVAPAGFDPAALFLLDLGYVNLYEPASARPGEMRVRCKGCRRVIDMTDRKRHHAAHKKTATNSTGRSTTMAKDKTDKTAKPNAKALGVPDVYLGSTGNFKPGADAACKSDLILAILEEQPRKNAPHFFSKADAEALFAKFPQWAGFLTRKREILDAKKAKDAAKANEKVAAAKAKADAKKAKSDTKKAKSDTKASAKATAVKGDDVTPDPKPESKPRRGVVAPK